MKRGFAFLALVIILEAGAASAASAQQVPTVRVSATTGMTVRDQCKTEPTTSPGSFTLARADTDGPLTVTYHIEGGPTDLNSEEVAGADHTVDFAAGEGAVTVTVHPAIDASDATVTVVDGVTYDPGDPPSGTIVVQHIVLIPESCEPPRSLAPTSTLARTGVRETSGRLALTGIASIALGSLLLVLSSRRKATGLR